MGEKKKTADEQKNEQIADEQIADEQIADKTRNLCNRLGDKTCNLCDPTRDIGQAKAIETYLYKTGWRKTTWENCYEWWEYRPFPVESGDDDREFESLPSGEHARVGFCVVKGTEQQPVVRYETLCSILAIEYGYAGRGDYYVRCLEELSARVSQYLVDDHCDGMLIKCIQRVYECMRSVELNTREYNMAVESFSDVYVFGEPRYTVYATWIPNILDDLDNNDIDGMLELRVRTTQPYEQKREDLPTFYLQATCDILKVKSDLVDDMFVEMNKPGRRLTTEACEDWLALMEGELCQLDDVDYPQRLWIEVLSDKVASLTAKLETRLGEG